MTAWFESIVGPDYSAIAVWLTAVAIMALVLYAFYRISRRFASGTFVEGGRNRRNRLAIVDAAAVDGHRKLVLIRRDDVEHLVLIGGPTDIVVEQHIRVVPRAARPAETEPTAAEPRAPAPPPAPEPQIAEVPVRQPQPRPVAVSVEAEPPLTVPPAVAADASGRSTPPRPAAAYQGRQERPAPAERSPEPLPEVRRPEPGNATLPPLRPAPGFATRPPEPPKPAPAPLPNVATTFNPPPPRPQAQPMPERRELPTFRSEPEAPKLPRDTDVVRVVTPDAPPPAPTPSVRLHPVAPVAGAGMAATADAANDDLGAVPPLEDITIDDPSLDDALLEELALTLEGSAEQDGAVADDTSLEEEMERLLGGMTATRS